jgi:hypothetical protein
MFFSIFRAVPSAFDFKVCKKCLYDIKKKSFKNAIRNKKAEFDADFESIEKKIEKTHMKMVQLALFHHYIGAAIASSSKPIH